LLKKRLVCSSVLVVAEDPWLPRSTCPVRSRGDDALGDLAFGHAHSSPKLGHEDQGWKRFLKARKARRRSEHDFRQASRSRREPVRALASATHTLYNLAVSELPATGDRPRRTCVVSAIGSGESLGKAHAFRVLHKADGLVATRRAVSHVPANNRGLERFQCLQEPWCLHWKERRPRDCGCTRQKTAEA